MSFRRVHFISLRTAGVKIPYHQGYALQLRYARRLTVEGCTLTGSSISLAGPLRDIKIINNTA